ncbi:MAG: hypothetical protein ACFFG0_07130 [Candidatus Thorarchaeota archaeon]
MSVECVKIIQFIPTVDLEQPINMTTKEQMLSLSDYALELLSALRDMEQHKGEMNKNDFTHIKQQLWETIDDITKRIFEYYLAQEQTLSADEPKN